MNEIIFNKVMEVLGITNEIPITENSNIKKAYRWSNFNIYYAKTDIEYTAIVSGKIPLEVAQTIYDKYPHLRETFHLMELKHNNPFTNWYLHEETNPIEWATTEQLNQLVKQALNEMKDIKIVNEAQALKMIIKAYETQKKNIERMNKEKLYIEKYYVIRAESLVILITELKDYYMRKTNGGKLEHSQVEKQTEILGQLYNKLIEIGNFNISTDQWIKKQGKNMISNDKSLQPLNLEEIKIKELLEKLDKTINPFSNPDIEMLDPSEYADKVMLSFELQDEKSTFLSIQDHANEIIVTYERDSNKITHTIDYIKEDGKNVQIEHTAYKYPSGKIGEKLTMISQYKEVKNPRNAAFEYNVSIGKIFWYSSDNFPDKEFIITELQEAIKMAEALTIEMSPTKENHRKKYVKNK